MQNATMVAYPIEKKRQLRIYKEGNDGVILYGNSGLYLFIVIPFPLPSHTRFPPSSYFP